MVRKLRNHLDPVARSLDVDLWTDERLQVGQPWDAGIRAAMDRTKLFLFCISAEAVASRYIRETEMSFARDKYDRGEALIVPIILKDVAWGWVPWLSELQAVPRHAKAIQLWRPQDSGFADAADRIGRLVRDRMSGGAA
jgi:hypothetical protein